MKCLVFSDSHGSIFNMRRAIMANRDAEVAFFLGDGLSDAEALSLEFPDLAWIAVRGNCDYTAIFRGSEVLKKESISLCTKRIVLTHGDLYDAKYSLDRLKYLALSENADILLFGHTHSPYEEYVNAQERSFYLFNPGSVSLSGASFGVMSFADNGDVLLSHGRLL